MILSRRGLFPQTPPLHLVNWPWGIAIRTFGGFSLYRGDEPVTYSRKAQRKPLALLKALIALGGTEVLAERLAEALWPDADGDMAHQALEVALHRLRKLIGLPEAIIFREGRLSLNGRFCWVDAYAFEHLLALAGEADKQCGADRTHMLLAQADTLYRGVFLVEEGGEWWTTALATRLRSKHLQVAWRLGQLHDEQGQWVQAAHHYERCLEADECPEAIYRRLMVCYQHLGRSLEALEVYQRCRRMLATTVNLLPSPETEAVRASIISGQ
jgi:DNA-binding SARP family transcriptional activator